MIPKTQDRKPAVQKTLPVLSDTSDAVLACTIAAKLWARKDGKFGRIANVDVFKAVTLLRKQTSNLKVNDAKLVVIDLSTAWNRQMNICLSSKTVAAIAHFTKHSLNALNEIASKCNLYVNSAACEKLLISVPDQGKIEIQAEGPVSLNSIRFAVKGNLIRLW